MYLLKKTSEAAEMRQKVYDLLLTESEANHYLACQLIVSGGLHKDFFAPLFALHMAYNGNQYFEYVDEEAQKLHTKLLFKFIAQDIEALEIYKTILTSNARNSLSKYIANLKYFEDWQTILKNYFLLTGDALQVVWTHKILPVQQILDKRIANKKLSMPHVYLDDIFPELEHCQVEIIELAGSSLENISIQGWQNYHVVDIYLNRMMPFEVIQKLLTHFPNAVSTVCQCAGNQYKGESHHEQRSNRMSKAKKMALTALRFYRRVKKQDRNFNYYHNRAHAYNNAGKYHMALYCYEYIIRTFPNYQECLYNMACSYARLRNKPKTLETITQMFFYYPLQDTEDILTDNDFSNFVKDKDFLKVLEKRGKV